MSWTLTINGHDAPAEDIKLAARDAFADLKQVAGATNGSLSGTGNDGPTVSISFPEPAREDDPTTSPEPTEEPA